MRFTWLVWTVAVASTACAKGSELELSGGSGGTGSGTLTGVTSTGSKSTTSSSMSTSTQSSMSTGMTSSSTGTPCSEQPCKLLAPQCGCGANEMCSIDVPSKARACIPAGTVPIGGVCSAVNDCAPGAMCLSFGATSSCLEFCNNDNDCTAPGGVCFFTINDGTGGNIPNVTLCSQNCDPTTNVGCAAGLGCQVAQDTAMTKTFTYCPDAGAGQVNAPCPNGSSDCAGGLGCFNTPSPLCLKWCKIASPNCGALLCQPLDPVLIVGSTEYGVCF